MQTGKMTDNSISQTLVKIVREEGVVGLYRYNIHALSASASIIVLPQSV